MGPFDYLGYCGRPDLIRDQVEQGSTRQDFRKSHLKSGPRVKRLEEGRLSLLLKGYMAGVGSSFLSQMAETYRTKGTLKADFCDGNYTVCLIDGANSRVEIYRNLCSAYAIYYCETPTGLYFGTNLAQVARESGLNLSVNREMLPVYFIYRIVPGTNTLFEGIKRLQPGERLSYSKGRLEVTQVRTFTDLIEPQQTDERESLERLETTMSEVLHDHWRYAPGAAGLLSGGVDSTYIQVHWNHRRQAEGQDGRARSAAVWLDHPQTRADKEYTESAVAELGTDHLFVPMHVPTKEHMATELLSLGEMPHHVQSFYFATLARGMANAGIPAGICGEGADGSFGTAEVSLLQAADQCRRLLPVSGLRHCVAFAWERVGKAWRAGPWRVADILDSYQEVEHPVNMAGAFTDMEIVEAFFGNNVAKDSMIYRQRVLLDQLCAPEDHLGLQRTTLVAFLSEAVNTANYWNQSAGLGGVEFLYPFLDSRMIRMSLNMKLDVHFVPGNPKQIIKTALARYVRESFIRRPKRGFGQPIFEWLSPGGCLSDAVAEIDDYDFVDKRCLKKARENPNWFLYNLLVFDLWHKQFIS